MSIILLVVICIPLVFVIPMWLQTIALGIPRTELALDPARWIGSDGSFWLTLLLGLVSFALGYVYIIKMKPGTISEDKPLKDEDLEEDEEEEELSVDKLEDEVEIEAEVEEFLDEEAEELSAEELDDEEEIEEED